MASIQSIWRLLDAKLDNTTHIPSAIQNALDRDFVVPRFIIDDIAAAADYPESEALVARSPSRMRTEIGMLAKLFQSFSYPHPEALCRYQIVMGCQPGINLCEVIFRALADDNSHWALRVRDRARRQMLFRTC
jgi:hypothetical protein